MITKKHLYISIVGIIIVTIGIVLFLQPMQQNNATEKVIESLQKQYNDTFTVTWSDIADQPHMETFNATVKAKNTGYVYDVIVKDGKASMDYDTVNEQMAANEAIEAALPNTYASVNNETVTLLSTVPITQEQLSAVLDETITTAYIYELNEENFAIATEHMDEFYQRSTMPVDDLTQYTPKTYTIELP